MTVGSRSPPVYSAYQGVIFGAKLPMAVIMSARHLIHVTRRYLRFGDRSWRVLGTLFKFDILRNTLPRLQHDFCTFWNEVVQEARNRRPRSTGTRRSPTLSPTGICARVTVVAESTGRGKTACIRRLKRNEILYPYLRYDTPPMQQSLRNLTFRT
jgi:hypothetical protein